MATTCRLACPLAPTSVIRDRRGRASLLAALTLALGAVVVAGCGDDPKKGDGPTPDAGPTAPCRKEDCKAIPMPGIACEAGTEPTFVCSRGRDLRCTWLQPRCSTIPTDASADGLVGIDAADGPAHDAFVSDGAVADATDASDASDDASDASVSDDTAADASGPDGDPLDAAAD